MIENYRDHAANERTFLAWIRTGIAVIAFGFVIEKLNIFIAELALANSGRAGQQLARSRLGGPLGRYDGLALIIIGIAVIVIAAIRFVRTTRLIDQPIAHRGDALRTELVVSVVLALLAGLVSVYLVAA
jgi:putative membrane protein